MADDGEKDAVAAAMYFLDLWDYAYNTWDLTEWNAISDPGCQFCQSVVDRVGENEAKGQYIERLSTVFHDIATDPPNADHAHYIVTTKATQGRDWTYGPDRELVHESGATTQVLQMAILRADEGWVLYGVISEDVD